jgi:hypothetical protein
MVTLDAIPRPVRWRRSIRLSVAGETTALYARRRSRAVLLCYGSIYLSIGKGESSITKTSANKEHLDRGGKISDETLNYDTVSSIRQPQSRTFRRQNDDLTLPETNTSPLENPDKSAANIGGLYEDELCGSKSARAIMSAGEFANREAAYLTAAVHADFEALAVLVALNHPRSKMGKLIRNDVAAGDVEAILEAMDAEARELGSTIAEVGRDMLADLDRWNEVPRERWQDASPVKSFFKKREYRFDPRDILGATRVKKCASNDNHKGSEGNGKRYASESQHNTRLMAVQLNSLTSHRGYLSNRRAIGR